MQNSLTCYLGDQHFKLENNKKSHNNLFPQTFPSQFLFEPRQVKAGLFTFL